jgi:hypothetical protein
VPRDDHLSHPVTLILRAVRGHRQQAGGEERYEQDNGKGKDQNIH